MTFPMTDLDHCIACKNPFTRESWMKSQIFENRYGDIAAFIHGDCPSPDEDGFPGLASPYYPPFTRTTAQEWWLAKAIENAVDVSPSLSGESVEREAIAND